MAIPPTRLRDQMSDVYYNLVTGISEGIDNSILYTKEQPERIIDILLSTKVNGLFFRIDI